MTTMVACCNRSTAGDPVRWNPHNQAMQCHGCGTVWEPRADQALLIPGLRRFGLNRLVDATGISGTGKVASGVCWPDEHLAMRWHTQHTSTAFYSSLEDLLFIHGHQGSTVLEWIDP